MLAFANACTTVNTYDSGNRLTQITNPDGSTIEYQYDTMCNRTAVIVGMDTTRYTFDDLNRLQTVTDSVEMEFIE